MKDIFITIPGFQILLVQYMPFVFQPAASGDEKKKKVKKVKKEKKAKKSKTKAKSKKGEVGRQLLIFCSSFFP